MWRARNGAGMPLYGGNDKPRSKSITDTSRTVKLREVNTYMCMRSMPLTVTLLGTLQKPANNQWLSSTRALCAASSLAR